MFSAGLHSSVFHMENLKRYLAFVFPPCHLFILFWPIALALAILCFGGQDKLICFLNMLQNLFLKCICSRQKSCYSFTFNAYLFFSTKFLLVAPRKGNNSKKVYCKMRKIIGNELENNELRELICKYSLFWLQKVKYDHNSVTPVFQLSNVSE